MGVLASYVPGFNEQTFSVSFPQPLAHLGYANVILGYEWLNPVFWTLAVELQYYLLLGLLFPLLASSRALWRTLALAGLTCTSFVSHNEQWLSHWLVFLLGIVTFQLRAGLIGRHVYLAWVAALSAACFYHNGVIIAAGSTTTARRFLRPYLLFLVSGPSPRRLQSLNLGGRFAHNDVERCVVLFFALGCAIAVAWCMYRYIERPSQRWSTAIITASEPVSRSPLRSRNQPSKM